MAGVWHSDKDWAILQMGWGDQIKCRSRHSSGRYRCHTLTQPQSQPLQFPLIKNKLMKKGINFFYFSWCLEIYIIYFFLNYRLLRIWRLGFLYKLAILNSYVLWQFFIVCWQGHGKQSGWKCGSHGSLLMDTRHQHGSLLLMDTRHQHSFKTLNRLYSHK